MTLTLEQFAARLEARDAAGGTGSGDDLWKPWHLEPAADEHPRFAALCAAHRLTVIDTLEEQLAELRDVQNLAGDTATPDDAAPPCLTEHKMRRGTRANNRREADGPRRSEPPALTRGSRSDEQAPTRSLDGRSNDARGRRAYTGTWVYYPWESKLVRLLRRDDFFAVITSRNREKITRDEQLSLRGKRVGVVGLSVGAEIAVTLAQEHLCGAIAIADFDQLELSNLNRLGGGVDDLGCNKAHLAARRIAKIDPYLEVEVFDDGLTDRNADRFMAGLDLVVEECDGMEMKLRIRELARERGINLLYAADERGMLSVEPYAYDRDLQPFHGRIPAPQPSPDAHPSERAFMRSLVEWLGGWESISERSRRSVDEIGRTLNGYPQLASEPRLAAAQVAHAARRILLGERLPAHFGYLDLEETLGSPSP